MSHPPPPPPVGIVNHSTAGQLDSEVERELLDQPLPPPVSYADNVQHQDEEGNKKKSVCAASAPTNDGIPNTTAKPLLADGSQSYRKFQPSHVL